MKNFAVTKAITKGLSPSFQKALHEFSPNSEIDLAQAQRQHQSYVQALKSMVSEVIELPAENEFPDGCFVEDTAIILDSRALINRLGAKERQGEERSVRKTLQNLGLEILDMHAPATLDGGDVLVLEKQVFVGHSHRTNEEGLHQLQKAIGDQLPVQAVPVSGALHLKSIMSAFDPETLLFADNQAGRSVADFMETHYQINKSFECVFLPDALAANVISIGSKVLIQSGLPLSEALLQNLAIKKNKTLIKVEMSELAKADGSLTCCSLLLHL